MTPLPPSKNGLLLTAMPGELLIYDREHGTAHCLNDLAGQIFKACRDRLNRAEAVASIAQQAGVDDCRARDLLEVGLRELTVAGLLAGPPGAGLSRRDFLGRWGTLAAVLPAVVSLAAPAATVAASGCCLDAGSTSPGSCEGVGGPTDCSCRCGPGQDCSDPARLCVRRQVLAPGGDCFTEFLSNTCVDTLAPNIAERFDPDCSTARNKVLFGICSDGCLDASYLCCQCT